VIENGKGIVSTFTVRVARNEIFAEDPGAAVTEN
jgi:hypothetical protein